MTSSTTRENMLRRFRPSPASIVLRSGRAFVLCILLAVAGWFAGGILRQRLVDHAFMQTAPLLLAAALFAWHFCKQVLVWWGRRYVLTSREVRATWGILRKTTARADLPRIQQIVVDRTPGERIFGLGTVMMTTAGSQLVDVSWVSVADPDGLVAELRSAVRACVPAADWLNPEEVSPMVIGLVGGIGAGKSEVAKAFAAEGFLVIDSDRDARAALDQPEVREQLVRWWGGGVVGADGKVDRKKIAEIVFSKPEERARLEALVHPMVKKGRGELIARAAAEGRPGVVIDAPLLIEAGSDKECDAVVFVDAPREVRLARVQQSRGWTEEELERREKAQLSLEDKRARADAVVINDGARGVLPERIRMVLQQIRDAGGAKKPPRN